MSAVGFSASEQPAVRAERARGEPSSAFMLGTALGAWINAAAQLDFDLKNPASAGPPHVSQTGGDPEALVRDCDDEKTAFDRLESRRRSLGLEPQQVLSAASLAQEILRAWQSRQGGLSSGCR